MDSFAYSYPAEYLGGDLLYGASNTALVYIAVEPVSIDLEVQGQYEGQYGPEAILPVNTGWEEEGMQGVGRVADNKNNGIVADLEDDPHLRSGTVTLSNDYPCSVTGYWTLSIPYYTSGQWKDYLSSDKIRVYRDVSGTWTEMFACEQIPVTIAAGQSVAVSLALEGLAQPPGYLRAFFHVIRLNDDVLQGGFGTDQWGGELSNPGAIDDHCNAYDEVYLTVAEVDLRVGGTTSPPAMPDVYEDTLPYVVPMNRDYDCGYMDGEGQPLRDNTVIIPEGMLIPPENSAEDDLVSAWIILPGGFHGTWKLTIPVGARVWRYIGGGYSQVVSGMPYMVTSGGQLELRVEGRFVDAVQFLTVTAQYADDNDDPIGLPLTDRVLVEVVSVDLQVQSISDYDEMTVPAIVPLNDDYDEGNTHGISGEDVTDNGILHGQPVSNPPGIVPSDDDLVHGLLTIEIPTGQSGKYWIEVTGEPQYLQYIRVWLADGSNEVPRDRASALPLDSASINLRIEGLNTYYNPTTPIRLIAHFVPNGDYPKAGLLPEVVDKVMADVVDFGLSIYNGGSDLDNGEATGKDGDEVPESKEDSEGAYLLVNWDDDDSDGEMNADGTFAHDPVPDLTETYVANEDNLAKLVPTLSPALNFGVVEIEVTSGADKIKLWAAKTKGTELELTGGKLSWDLSVPAERTEYQNICANGIWIEGIATSAAERDVTFVFRYKYRNQTIATDTVKATVVMINLGNAVYRESSTPITERGHAALVTGYTGACTKTDLQNDANFEIIEMQMAWGDTPAGVRKVSLATMTQAGYNVWGCFTNTASMTYVGRLRVLAAAKALLAQGTNIGYTAVDAVKSNDPDHPERWNGRLDTIASLRCDGLVEVCYEINGIMVWGMLGPDGTSYTYDITDQTDNWSYSETSGTWIAGGNNIPDNLEAHNDFDFSAGWRDWLDTLMPSTQCGHFEPEDADTTFTQQDLCSPVGSTGGN